MRTHDTDKAPFLVEGTDVDIVGVIIQDEASAIGGDGNWRVVYDLHGWREGKGPLRKDKLTVELPLPDEEVDRYMRIAKAYSLLQFDGVVVKTASNALIVTAREAKLISDGDKELETYAVELSKPLVYKDPVFGAFTLDRSLGWFDGHIRFSGKRIEVNLDAESDLSKAKEAAVELRRIVNAERSWATRLKKCAVEHLLPLKNDAWRGDNGWKIPGWWFRYRMKVESATVWPDGRFEFWYDDGGLFFGHSITVSGTVAVGPTSADISG